MKSIKPGRGPSGMNFIASIGVIIFGVIWTIFAAFIGGAIGGIGLLFPLFGLVFICMGIAQAKYHYTNATGKDRYSLFDITEPHEEGDPSDNWIRDAGPQDFAGDEAHRSARGRGDGKADYYYCPYCGTRLEESFAFCPKCGKSVDNA
ncbi:MAG TPA: zinc-ribbon domain-containing protein [Candidatus Atribacteria bacterium]|nr:zinc-ribbon domain-containing protein [Candidatus Atribacteria bacterium]